MHLHLEVLCLFPGLNVEQEYQSSSSPLQIIESFLEALTNADKDGRVVVNRQGKITTFGCCETFLG